MIKQNWLLSINPDCCLALIDLRSNRLVAYEPLKVGALFSFSDETLTISFLSIDDSGTYLGQVKIQNLLEKFQSSAGKQAIKLILKQRALQDMAVMSSFVTSLFRNAQPEKLTQSKEYKALEDLVRVLDRPQIAVTMGFGDGEFGQLCEAEESCYPLAEETPDSVSEAILRQRAKEIEDARKK